MLLRRFLAPAAALALLVVAACSSGSPAPTASPDGGAATTPAQTSSPTSDAGGTTVTTSSDGAAPDDASDGDASGADAGSADATVDSPDSTAVDLAPYRIIGRYDTRDPAGPRFGWSGTQVHAVFTGDAITIDLADTGPDQFDVSIDGAAPTKLVMTNSPRTTYPLASGLGAGSHDLLLTKRTESSVGITQLFAINATLTGTPGLATSTRRIEMIGDSITCGYGVLGADETCQFSPGTEDEALAWGALAAAQLNAAHTAISWSGIGLLRNYDQTTTETMPQKYPRALATDPESMWTPSAFEPDVIVINLGTNDFAGASSDPGPAFQSTLVTFLGSIRAIHPNAKIILATSPMLSGDHHAELLAYLQGAMAAKNDPDVSVLDIPVAPDANGFGCNYHPSVKTQEDMATKLALQIKSVTGW